MISPETPQLWKHITKESILRFPLIDHADLTMISSLDDIKGEELAHEDR